MTYPPATPPEQTPLAQTPSEQTPLAQTPADRPLQPTQSPPPLRSKSRLTIGAGGAVALLAISVVAAVAVGCQSGNAASGNATSGNTKGGEATSAVSTQTTAPEGYITNPSHTSATPTAPTGETYNLHTGRGVRLTFDDGKRWSVKLVGTHWYPAACNGYGGTDPVLVVDLQFSAESGTGSLNILSDLKFVDSDGNVSISTGFTGCVRQELDSLNVPAGQKRNGQADFVVASGKGGLLEYEDTVARQQQTGPVATWIIEGP